MSRENSPCNIRRISQWVCIGAYGKSSSQIIVMKNDYILTVGLEIHAELKTRTKMFCDSKNDPDEIRPNVNICPVCM